MQVHFGAFGDLRNYMPAPVDRLVLEVTDQATVADLLAQLGVPWGEVGIVAVNGKLADEKSPLNPGDLVEIFDPVGGG
ncbi:MAG: MoaD/ThiS family protein [Chloroflexota bacterium]